VVVPEDRAKKTVQELMDSLLLNRTELEAENASLKTLNSILKSQRSDALEMLSRLEQEKRSAEVEQFSKFVLLLNAKKTKIAELRAQLQNAIQSQRNTQHDGGGGAHSHRSSQTVVDNYKSQYSSASPSIHHHQHHHPHDYGGGGANGANFSIDPLEAHFDSHEVYSLSTPQLSRKKSDLILQGKLKPLGGTIIPPAKPSSRPQNLFDLQTPGSLASCPSSIKRQPSHQAYNAPSSSRHTEDHVSGKRSRLDDVLAMDDASDNDHFPLPEPKKWKY
jgi:hypothetical protein